MTDFDLTDSIHGIHHRLVAQLEERRRIPHPTLKGDEGELLWLNVLKQHLPRRYAVRSGIVIDSKGCRSEAIDLIIYDPQYTPVFLAQDEHAYVFAEAVYAVFEVKYELNKEHIGYAAKKAASVRGLHRTNGPVYHAGGIVAEPRPLHTQIAGLLTLSHTWKSSLESKLCEHVGGCIDHRALDLVLCLQGGLFESGAQPPDPASSFETGPTGFVLFLYSLLHRLLRLATVPVVEWQAYSDRVRSVQGGPGGEP